jgi:DNA-binding FrmR family transcriptional regulator
MTMDEELKQFMSAIETRLSRIEAKVDAIPVLLSNMRDCLAVLDAQVRGQGAILTRLEESISMDPSAQA